MPVKNHPFRKVFFHGPTPRPYLDVVLINPHTGHELEIIGLIDTGADECCIPADLAPLLEHNLKKGKTKEIIGVGGKAIAYTHTIKIKIPKFCTAVAPIDFIPGLTTTLLGVKSFLSSFKLTVDYKKQVFSLTKP